MELVKYGQPVFMDGEKKPGIRQLFAVPEVFPIKAETVKGLSELPGEGGFPNSPGPSKDGGRLAAQGTLQFSEHRAGYILAYCPRPG